MRRSGGSADSSSRAASALRPRRQLAKTTKTAAATASGNQPPCATLTMLAPKNARSTTRNVAVTPAAGQSFHPQTRRATTKARSVVMIMVVVTATP